MFDVNSSVLFWFAGVVILFVLLQSVFFLVKALRRAKELNMPKKKDKANYFRSGGFYDCSGHFHHSRNDKPFQIFRSSSALASPFGSRSLDL
nr:DUF5058 family protein [Treponema sp. OMZ 788]